MMMRFRPLSDRSGAALAEAAIALPIILVLFSGIFAFGTTLFNAQVLETAARDAARYIAQTNATGADETAARNIAVYGNTGGAGTARVRGLTAGNVGITYATVNNPITNASTGERTYRAGATVKIVRVEITWVSNAAGFWGMFGASPVTYHAVNRQRVIGG